MKEIIISTILKELEHISEYTSEELLLVENAQQAAQDAYAPYSQFSVGAAVLLENGVVVCGSNQENAAYPSGICAERVALFYAGAQYPNVAPIKLAITSYKDGVLCDKPVPPCAACRQVMLEVEKRHNKSFTLLLNGAKLNYIVDKAGDLVPLKFDEDYLT